MKRTFVLLFAAAACSRPSADSQVGSLDSTFSLVCGTPADSVPFTRVDLGPARTTPTKQNAVARELIQTETEWKERWAAFGDSTPAPALNFQDSIVVVVASPLFETGASTMEIEGVRRCVGTDDLVVPVRIHNVASESKQPARTLRAVQIAKADWKNHRITFVDMPATPGAR